MGPKYEFTGETMNRIGDLLHRIRRLSDGKIGGWIKKEENLSQEGNCWVDDNAIVIDDAKVYGNAQIYGNALVRDNVKVYGNAQIYDGLLSGDAKVYGNAKIFEGAWVHTNAQVYGNAKVYDESEVCENAKVYGNAEIYGNAVIYGNAEIYGDAQVYNNAIICGDAKVYGKTEVHGSIKISKGDYSNGNYSDVNNSSENIVKDFIYKVDDSNKITTQTKYNSIDEFFSKPITNDIKLDTLVICTVDTKEPLVKLQKIDSNNTFKFIVEITSNEGDDFVIRSVIKSKDQLNQLIQQTIEALKQYPQFSKYADNLEDCL